MIRWNCEVCPATVNFRNLHKMKILYLIFTFHTGGIEKQLIELSRSVAEKNEVTLCVINHSYDEDLFRELSGKVRLILLQRKNGGEKLSFMWKFAGIVKREKIDVIHAQEPTGVVFSMFAKIARPSVRIVETIHDVGESKLYSKLQLTLADRLCDHYIAISKTVQNELLERGISLTRISLIYNGVNTDKFSAAEIKKEMYSSVSVKGSILLGNVARFYPAKKGQDILVQAVEILKQRKIHVHCKFAGAVYRGQEAEWQKLQCYLQEHHLEQDVEFVGNVSNVQEFLQDIDIFVLPSRFEGFGIALIEALSMGIPCVASRLDGPSEILTDTRLGLTFEPGSPFDLANQIEYMVRHYQQYDPDFLSRYVKEHFSLHALTENHMALYQRICDRNK